MRLSRPIPRFAAPIEVYSDDFDLIGDFFLSIVFEVFAGELRREVEAQNCGGEKAGAT